LRFASQALACRRKRPLATRRERILALREGEVVAQVAAVIHRHPDKPTERYIDEVGVTPALQRQGIACRMVAEMFALGKALAARKPGSAPNRTTLRRAGSLSRAVPPPSRSSCMSTSFDSQALCDEARAHRVRWLLSPAVRCRLALPTRSPAVGGAGS
jgi:acetyltransferase (GNAT) family protein